MGIIRVLEPNNARQVFVEIAWRETPRWSTIFPNYVVGSISKLETVLQLIADPTNAADKNAVEVHYGDINLGFLPRSAAKKVSKELQLMTADGDVVFCAGAIVAVKAPEDWEARVYIMVPKFIQ